MLTVAKVDKLDFVNNPGGSTCSTTIWLSGCTVGCAGCHNTTLWDKNKGTEVDPVTLVSDIVMAHDITGSQDIVITGGEPLEQDYDSLFTLMRRLKHEGYNVWLYTSFNLDEIPEGIKDLCSYIKTGKYRQDLPGKGILASNNQTIWKKVDNKFKALDV